LKSRSFDNSDSLKFFFFIEFSFSSAKISDDVGYASLESTESCEVRGALIRLSLENYLILPLIFSSISGEKTELSFLGGYDTIVHKINIFY